jgi:hypothetical protein
MHLLTIKSALDVEEEDDEDIDENISSLFWTDLQEQETTKELAGVYLMLARGDLPGLSSTSSPWPCIWRTLFPTPGKHYSIVFKVS